MYTSIYLFKNLFIFAHDNDFYEIDLLFYFFLLLMFVYYHFKQFVLKLFVYLFVYYHFKQFVLKLFVYFEFYNVVVKVFFLSFHLSFKLYKFIATKLNL